MKTTLDLAALLFMATLVLAGCDAHVNKVAERFVDVDAGGHALHMLIVGDHGPTVVLESGLPGGIGMEQIRQGVGHFARVVAYDRAGLGDSQSGPLPRTAKQIAAELHAALENAELPPPYVLVGHSMGGPYIRVFAAMYPQDVSGMVLVDPSEADYFYEPMEDLKAWIAEHCPDDWQHVEAACQHMPEGMESLGWLFAADIKRIEQYLASLPEGRRERMREGLWDMLDSYSQTRSTPKFSTGVRDEFQAATESIRQAIAAKPLPNVPIVLLAGVGHSSFGGLAANFSPNGRALQQQQRRWHFEDYRRWVEATPGAKLVMATQSGHDIPDDEPELIIDAVRQIVEQHPSRTR